MPQNTVLRTLGRSWDFLEPAIDPNFARLIHGKMIAAAAGTTVSYPAGQVVRQKTDGTNVWAKDGVTGYAGPARIIKYPITVDENGFWQFGPTFYTGGVGESFETSVEMYYQGKFKCQDLTAAALDDTVGRLISGTYTAGILQLGEATA
jgi:hypothetical protein